MTSDIVPTIVLREGAVEIIDQTRLPAEYKILRLTRVDDLCEAIKSLRIRGAPALGVAGAYGLLLGVEERWPPPADSVGFYFDAHRTSLDRLPPEATVTALREYLNTLAAKIASTRPTAINLGWAVTRLRNVFTREWNSPAEMLAAIHREAMAIYEEDLEMCRSIGRYGAELLRDGDHVITHCNTGGLATSGYGTALGVVFAAVESGKKIHVFADETRPLLQGARLNAWECERRAIPVSVLCDGAAASLMGRGLISCAIVGADRIAANGDTANKIGTLSLAIAARHFKVPFYVAAPSSTIDPSIPDGNAIPIEERAEEEVKGFSGVQTTPSGVGAVNPAFDVTPHDLIAGFVTEKGILQPPFDGPKREID